MSSLLLEILFCRQGRPSNTNRKRFDIFFLGVSFLILPDTFTLRLCQTLVKFLYGRTFPR